MIIDVYYSTQDKSALHTFSLVIEAHHEWRKQLLAICAQHGFESFLGPDFCVPTFFLQERFSQKSRSRGFHAITDKSVFADPNHELYTLRLDYPVGANLYNQMDTISRNQLESINLTQAAYGQPRYVGYQHATCLLLNISHIIARGDILAFSQIWRVLDDKEAPLLICSIPVSINNNQYHIPQVPEIWQDISATSVISLFNSHNRRLSRRNPQ